MFATLTFLLFVFFVKTVFDETVLSRYLIYTFPISGLYQVLYRSIKFSMTNDGEANNPS